MKPERQRIAIAEACPSLGWWMDHEGHWRFKDGSLMRGGSVLTDLNAMHQAKKTLTPEQRVEMINHVYRIQSTSKVIRLHPDFDTEASVESEAFLRTIGKWEDE